jgi:HSP20 family molecular chaperone IbpA
MGDAESGVWYALTISIGNDGKQSRGDTWDPPLEMNRWLPPATHGGTGAARKDDRVVTPPVDVRIRDGELTLFAEMPGIPPDNIDIRVMPRFIEIIGIPAEPGGGAQQEDRLMQRAIPPAAKQPRHRDGGAPDGARARLRDGVLELRISKSAMLSGRGKVPVPLR